MISTTNYGPNDDMILAANDQPERDIVMTKNENSSQKQA